MAQMLPQHRNTLESAGYTYNPFTTNDIWGAPAQIDMPAAKQHELPVGADDGAIPSMAAPHLRNGAPRQGSDQSEPWVRGNSAKEQMLNTNTTYLLLFAGILAAALVLRAPGSA